MKPLTNYYVPKLWHACVANDADVAVYRKDEADAVIRELEAERDAARADAERYRWLREIGCGAWWDGWDYRQLFDEKLDEAIDAARSRE